MTIEEVRDTYKPRLSVQEQCNIRKELGIELKREVSERIGERGKLKYSDYELRQLLQHAGFRKINKDDIGKYVHSQFIS